MTAVRVDPLAPPTVPVTAESVQAFASAWRIVEKSMTAFASRVSDSRADQEDLLQEARMGLWMADPTRYDLRSKEDVAYLHRVLICRMWDAWGEERGRKGPSGEDGGGDAGR